jgi:hypothetical protein
MKDYIIDFRYFVGMDFNTDFFFSLQFKAKNEVEAVNMFRYVISANAIITQIHKL